MWTMSMWTMSRLIRMTIILLWTVEPTHGWQSHSPLGETNRRQFVDISTKTMGISTCLTTLLGGSNVARAETSTSKSRDSLRERLDTDILVQPTPTLVAQDLQGVDNFFYPSFMAGTWNVTQTLVKSLTPLGLIYLGGPNGDLAIAQKTQTESSRRIGIPVDLQLRYLPTKWGVAEDRAWNTKNRLNAFAGRSVVASTSYADVGACNRAKVLAKGGTEDDPLQTTFVRFKGPAAQKIFLTSHRADPLDESPSWTGSEGLRSIFALTNENTAPPIFTDTESIWQFTLLAPNHVQGRLRLASYLNAQQDKLYFETKNRAVSLLDYTLDMKRVSD